jgi:hypothetical protein
MLHSTREDAEQLVKEATMPQWVVLVPVTVDAATPDEAVAWVTQELAAKRQPDEGTGWHTEGIATPRYQVASVRRVPEASATPTYKRGQG